MAAWHFVVTWVAPALFVAAAGAILVLVSRGSAAKALDRLPSGWWWPLFLLWAGDAAVGENRPPGERITKGVGVGLLIIAYAVAWLRARRSRPAPAEGATAGALPPYG